MRKYIWDIVIGIFGILLLILSFGANEFEYMISNITASWDRLIITGYASGLFVLTYGVGLSMVLFSFMNIKNKLGSEKK